MGKVYLVGAGPGDPGLITVRGLDLLRRADVVLYDNLATPALLAAAPARAEKLYVGKKRASHAYSQDEINALLVDRAAKSDIVVRFKGGDPFVFGRGGEEGEALAAAGVAFEVVPGVSSALGAAAYAGIPLTHRDHTSAVTFVTGHELDRIDWTRLGHAETLVVFMGLTTIGEIARRIIAAGRPASTPAAAIRWATRPDQQTVVGTLADLEQRIADSGLRPPALVVVGDVVSLRETLSWYEQLPLFGQRVVVTRASAQAADLCESLRRLGAEPVEAPAIEIVDPEDFQPLDQAIERLETYDWLLFTSRNGVDRFLARLDQSDRDLRAVRGRIAAIGPATAQALEAAHLKVDVTPEEFVAEGLLDALAKHPMDGKHVLLPRAAEAREILPEQLRERGAVVDVVPAYRTVRPEGEAQLADADWITFTSSSTVRNTVEALGVETVRRLRIASIGPVTSRTAGELGLQVDVEAAEHTVEGLLSALVQTLD